MIPQILISCFLIRHLNETAGQFDQRNLQFMEMLGTNNATILAMNFHTMRAFWHPNVDVPTGCIQTERGWSQMIIEYPTQHNDCDGGCSLNVRRIYDTITTAVAYMYKADSTCAPCAAVLFESAYIPPYVNSSPPMNVSPGVFLAILLAATFGVLAH